MIPICPEGGNLAQLPPTWNLKMMMSYAPFMHNIVKLFLAPWALASNTLKLSLRCRKIAKILVRAFVIFVSPRGFAPLWKNSCGRP